MIGQSMGKVIDLSKRRPGRHRAHRADKFAHPAFRRQEVYAWGGNNGRVPLLVDEYQPKHAK